MSLVEKLKINEFIRKVSFLSSHKFKLDIPINENENHLVHINDLIALSDEEFIETAYWKILKRVADPEGKIGKILDLKNNSRSRLDILDELKSSDEAKNYKEIVILGLGDVETHITRYDVSFEDFIEKTEFSEFEFSLLLDYLNAKHTEHSQWLIDNEGLVFDLLEYDSIDFIFLTYKMLLQRDPDFEGFTDYITDFDNSYISKIIIIHDFSQSDEYKNSRVVIKDLSIKDIGDYDSPDQISLDLSVRFESLHHFLYLRNKDCQLDTLSIEKLASKNTLCFMFLLMEKIKIPFSERLEYFNRYIPQVMGKEKTKVDIIYQSINDRYLVSEDSGISLSNHPNDLLSRFYNEDDATTLILMDMLGKNIFLNATKQDAQTNNIYYQLSQKSLRKDFYQRCKDQLFKDSSTTSTATKVSSLTEDMYSLTKCIDDLSTKNDINTLKDFVGDLIKHVDFIAEALIDHESKISDLESDL